MQCTGTVKTITLDYETKKPIISLLLNCDTGIDKLKDKKLNVELKEYKEKRSLNSNAYRVEVNN